MSAVRIVATGLEFPEGPIALADGSVLVVEIRRGTLTRVAPDGTATVVASLGGGPNGAAIGPDGAVYVCNNGGFEWHEVGGYVIPGHAPADYAGGSIQRVDLATGRVTVLYTEFEGAPLQGPNDIVFDRTGGFWFTDHGKSTARGRSHGALYYARPDGSRLVRARAELLTPNGVGLSPDESVLYMAETLTGRLWAFDLVSPGVLAAQPAPWLPGRLVATLPGYQLLDSLKVTAHGNICVGTLLNGGITEFTPSGHVRHFPFSDIGITNLCFFGSDMRDLWATGSSTGRLYRWRWHEAGLRLPFNV
jgi:gluconolactonase